MNEETLRRIVREELAPLTIPRLLTSQDAATALSVKESTLRQWRVKNKGPEYVMVEGAVRYEISTLNAYVNKKRVVV